MRNNHAITKYHAVPQTTNDAVFSTSGRCWVASFDPQVQTQIDARAYNISSNRQFSSCSRIPKIPLFHHCLEGLVTTPILRSPSFRGGPGPARPLQPSAGRNQPCLNPRPYPRASRHNLTFRKLLSPTSITSRWHFCMWNLSSDLHSSGTPRGACNNLTSTAMRLYYGPVAP